MINNYICYIAGCLLLICIFLIQYIVYLRDAFKYFKNKETQYKTRISMLENELENTNNKYSETLENSLEIHKKCLEYYRIIENNNLSI